ncbi:MAG: DUF177 domain-containing protein [Pseudomonadota bacterium]
MDTLPPLTPEFSRPLALGRLPRASVHQFEHSASAEDRAKLAELWDAQEVPKLSFSGTVEPLGKQGWALSGRVRCTVIQTCVVTLQPVATKIDQTIERQFLPDRGDTIDQDDPDDLIEPLCDVIDLGLIASEAVALLLPDYPRAADAALPEQAPFEEPERENPFAVLAQLKSDAEKPQ